jgi:hypothetical protein
VGQVIYHKHGNKLIIFLSIIIIVLLGIGYFYPILFQTSSTIEPPKHNYNVEFSGESNVRYKDFLYSFQPTVISSSLGDSIEFRLMATNLGNKTITFEYGSGDPVVYVDTKNGSRISIIAPSSTDDLLLHLWDLSPGENFTVRWTWNSASYVSSPIPPGEYLISTKIWTGEYVLDPEDHVTRSLVFVWTSKMYMLVL